MGVMVCHCCIEVIHCLYIEREQDCDEFCLHFLLALKLTFCIDFNY